MAKAKRYEDGGVTEGQNSGIGDDTRARAMKYIQEQSEKGSEDEGSGEKVVSRATKSKVSTKPAAAKAESKPAAKAESKPADEPKTTVSRSEAREPSGEPTPSKGNSASGSALGRNIKNTLMAMGPTRLAGLGNAAAEGAMASRAAKAVAAREAKTLNPSAWMAGPKGMKENFKSGGGVKGWGIARGSRTAKTY